MTPATIRVMCVEDNDLVADAIGRKLEGTPGFAWLGCADTLERLLAMAADLRPNVVCMDLDIPGQDAFAMIRALAQSFPNVRVLILTGHVTEQLIDRAVQAGAWGYLSKAEDSRAIVDSIRRVASGEFVLDGIARRECGAQIPTRPAAAPVTPARSWNPLTRIFPSRGPQRSS